ncbi:hypothetical protein E1B28_011452 [Marasmius oreades]|uniref:Glycosyl transferase family 25 domain-containing protein n=1 Tax=Marasmius oreades TaxID=181124 RepID=A0A9P7RUA9_9AGAR|nr:uncharacterized protein E1B28_011452 [Marasmius oreades]KAG7089802.1 hypothetical protein E1B28_011452 [Marasmius oreades]
MALFRNGYMTSKSRNFCLRFLALLFLFSVLSLLLALAAHRKQSSLPTQMPQDLPAPLAPLISQSERIYIISLQHRHDRRVDMEKLRVFLRIPSWTYVVATDSADEIVGTVMKNIRLLREWVVREVLKTMEPQGNVPINDFLAVNLKLPFGWPMLPKLNKTQRLAQYLPLLGSMADFDVYQSASRRPASQNPLVVSKGDFTLTAFTPTLGRHMILSPARVACWHSHLQTIRKIIGSPNAADITIILEDDIDMEIDIRRRLSRLWGLLPLDWDIVFLGHCWSDEAKYTPLASSVNSSCSSSECYEYEPHTTADKSAISANLIHPSHAPQCTHAYALSPRGAKKLYDHLTYPPFAYSRGIDQAFSWLVKSGRINAFSVVPAVVAQRVQQKQGWISWIASFGKSHRESNIWDTPSRWRDRLVNGVFGVSGEEEGSW